jgi:type VI protein secretion system component VasF
VLRLQAVQLGAQAKQLQTQVSVIQQQDKTLQELRTQLAGADSSNANNAAVPGSPKAGGSDAEQLNEQIALAVRAVLTGVSSMACLGTPAGKDAAQMQQMVGQLPDALLQQIRSCCREVALHLKKTEVKEQPHAITVPCC